MSARSPDTGDRTAAREAWLTTASRPDVRAALAEIFEEAKREIELRAPACWASGRCCNFDRAGHRLYVSRLEAAYCVQRLHEAGAPPLTHERIDRARRTGGCPFQQGNLCSAHEHKPIGCRVYFCDRSAQQWQHDLSERLLAKLREAHDRLGVPYEYTEWRGLLEGLAVDGGRPPERSRADASRGAEVPLPVLRSEEHQAQNAADPGPVEG